MRARRILQSSVVLALSFLVSAASADAKDDPQHLQAARDLAEEGYGLFAEERYEEALDRLERAYRMVEAPTIKVLQAEVLVELGRFVEAREAYELVLRTELDEEAPPAFAKAREKAERELAALKPRIPGITVVLEGDHPPGLIVKVDDKPLDEAVIGVRWPVDPGEHSVEVSSDGGRIAKRTVTLEPGQQERVVIVLTSAPADAPPEAVVSEPRPSSRTPAWISLGVGGLGLGVGVVSGAVMLSKKSDLDEACDDLCPETARSDHDAFRRARTVSWVGYGVGVVGVGVGAVLLLKRPKERPAEAVRIRPVVGPLHVGVTGRF